MLRRLWASWALDGLKYVPAHDLISEKYNIRTFINIYPITFPKKYVEYTHCTNILKYINGIKTCNYNTY